MIAKEIGPVPASAPESSGHHERNGHVPTKRKPKSLAVLAENILEHLKRLRIWVGWRWELRKGKWAKVPIDVKTGKRARSNKHATWSSFQEAWDFYRLASNETDGIGIVLDHPVDGLVGVDLDRCVAADQLNDKARSILIDLDTYAELSPSGTGAKALALLDAPGLARGFNNREAGVEMYDRGRFWTITGHPLVPFSKGLSNRTVVVKQLFERYATTAPSPLSNGQVIGERKKPRNKLSDAEVLERARRAKNGQRFSAVYDGKLTRATDGPLCSPAFKRPFRSASEVDAALCRMIAFYTGD